MNAMEIINIVCILSCFYRKLKDGFLKCCNAGTPSEIYYKTEGLLILRNLLKAIITIKHCFGARSNYIVFKQKGTRIGMFAGPRAFNFASSCAPIFQVEKPSYLCYTAFL